MRLAVAAAWVSLVLAAGAPARGQDLELCVLRHDLLELRSLVAQGVPVDERNVNGETPLYRAVQGGDGDTVAVLLELGADKEATDLSGKTPLMAALEGQQPDQARRLLKAGARPEPADLSGLTALHRVSATTDEGLGAELLRRGAPPAPVDATGRTPLHMAAAFDQEDQARQLLEAGAPTRSVAADGSTPLHEAARSGSAGVARLLLSHQADAEARDASGRDPFQLASEAGYPDVLRALQDAVAPSELHQSQAAAVGATDVLEQLLARGQGLGTHGGELLARACQGGRAETAAWLLDQGVAVNGSDAEGRTPWHWAATSGNRDLLELLLHRGADVAARDAAGRTGADYLEARRLALIAHLEELRALRRLTKPAPALRAELLQLERTRDWVLSLQPAPSGGAPTPSTSVSPQ